VRFSIGFTWLRRNKLVFEEKFSPPLMVFREASNLIEDFRLFSTKEQKVVKPGVDTLDNSKIWKNPNLGTIKVNWDASINLRDGVLGLGCVIRNDVGLVVGAKCCVCKVEADPLLAEVMTAYLVITFSKKMGFTNIECDCDSLQAIQGIRDTRSPNIRIGHFVEEIRHVASSLSSCYWIHCCGEVNVVAHVIAREASSKYISLNIGMRICLSLYLMLLIDTF
jgi:hypothetical protein